MFTITRSLDCRGRQLILDRTRICGILNVTPDSFSDGGAFDDPQRAIAQGLVLIEQGADMLDIGGESTRPGAEPVGIDVELARVLPVIEALAAQTAVPISIDTSKPEVMRAAVTAGAGMINDVYALRRPGALDAAAESGATVCLMHMQGEPQGMQDDPHYEDVVGEVHRFLAERLFACQLAGIDKKKLVVDVGFGFGKTLAHNLALLRDLDRFKSLEVPLLVGLSRKTMISKLSGDTQEKRLHGSVAAALIAAQRGAAIVRVHDVAATQAALAIWSAIHDDQPVHRSSKAVGIKSSWDDE